LCRPDILISIDHPLLELLDHLRVICEQPAKPVAQYILRSQSVNGYGDTVSDHAELRGLV